MKKALIITRVSGFLPQFEMNNVRILKQLGYEVHYAANFEVVVYGKDNSRLEGSGIVCHHIPFCRSPLSSDVRTAYKSLKQLMLTEAFDLVHCHMPMSGVVARMAAQAVRRKTGRHVPVLYTAHGFHFFKGAPLKNWVYYLPERWLARYTDCLITMNEEDFRRAGSFPVRGRVEKIPGVGICVQPSGGWTDCPIRGREREWMGFGIRETDFVLVSVGEFNANKNHIQILRALVQCGDPSVKYILCGQGERRGELENFVREHHLESQVIFAGYRPDVEHILASSDLFVFPSLREGLSMAVMEAMRAGLPVVAKEIRGNIDLIEDGRGGILVKNGDVSEYVHAIQRMKGQPELAERMGEWNRERIRQFSLEQVERKMQSIYEYAEKGSQ